MVDILVTLKDIPRKVIPIAFVGENEHTNVLFDGADIFNDYPDAAVSLLVTSPTKVTYPKSVARSGNIVSWSVAASDCVSGGQGEYQLTFTNGAEIIKSEIGTFFVLRSITGGGTPPSPFDDWMKEAQALLDSFANMTAEATTLDPDSDATAELDDVDGHKVLVIGVPKGEKGEQGEQGIQGRDGNPGYVFIRYSEEEPVQDSDMKTEPDAWMGIYSGSSSTAPTEYTSYVWYKIKGDQGDVSTAQYNELIYDLDRESMPASVNLWNVEDAKVGYLHPNGNYYAYEDYIYGDVIGSVETGDILNFYGIPSWASSVYPMEATVVTCYDENGDAVSASGVYRVTTFTVPIGIKSIKITLPKGYADQYYMVLKNNVEAPTSYIPYYEPFHYFIAKQDFIRNAFAELLYSGDIILNLPSKIYALSGYELNIYFENITEKWKLFSWDVVCTKGRQMERGYTITPTDADVGTYSLKIKAKLSEYIYKEIETSLIIVGSEAGSGQSVSVIVLGDSTTDYGVMVTKLNANFSNDVVSLSTNGTRGTAPNNHEGRSGWTFAKYFTVSEDNPFYNPTSQTFDASYYFANSGISVPDWFFINLGINDVFGYETDAALNAAIQTIFDYCDAMIASLKSASNTMKIGLCVTIPPNDSQDSFGKAYVCGQTRDRCKRNNTIWASRLISKYSGKESERVYLVPIHTNLDTVYNMGMETLPVNARNTSVTYQSPIANGGVHPVESGYWQIADIFTAFIKGNVGGS